MVGLDEIHPHCDDNHDGLADEIALAAVTLRDVGPVWTEDHFLLEKGRLPDFCALAFPASL